MVRKYQQQIKDSIYTSLVVGTILVLINHIQAIINVSFTALDLLHWLLNFLVPFTVSLYSRIAALKKEKASTKVLDV